MAPISCVTIVSKKHHPCPSSLRLLILIPNFYLLPGNSADILNRLTSHTEVVPNYWPYSPNSLRSRKYHPRGYCPGDVSTLPKPTGPTDRNFENLHQVASPLQGQINSLASLVLQHRRALDLLMAQHGGTCPLEDGCCYSTNQSRVVTDSRERSKTIRVSTSMRSKQTKNNMVVSSSWPHNGDPYGPTIRTMQLNQFQNYVHNRIRAVSQDQFKTVMLLHQADQGHQALHPNSQGDSEL